ncbi:hypothetical protein FGO68_gene17011 [Halteria grandinella]|uniref:Uncharacterized protein n=1 Tax=Halteria grandinella TaxID=5974 RepID=A0A8J8NMX0_HALGN|nr:hypothetical protein FGO68_gene17011 [Halteria grandinella]
MSDTSTQLSMGKISTKPYHIIDIIIFGFPCKDEFVHFITHISRSYKLCLTGKLAKALFNMTENFKIFKADSRPLHIYEDSITIKMIIKSLQQQDLPYYPYSLGALLTTIASTDLEYALALLKSGQITQIDIGNKKLKNTPRGIHQTHYGVEIFYCLKRSCPHYYSQPYYCICCPFGKFHSHEHINLDEIGLFFSMRIFQHKTYVRQFWGVLDQYSVFISFLDSLHSVCGLQKGKISKGFKFIRSRLPYIEKYFNSFRQIYYYADQRDFLKRYNLRFEQEYQFLKYQYLLEIQEEDIYEEYRESIKWLGQQKWSYEEYPGWQVLTEQNKEFIRKYIARALTEK